MEATYSDAVGEAEQRVEIIGAGVGCSEEEDTRKSLLEDLFGMLTTWVIYYDADADHDDVLLGPQRNAWRGVQHEEPDAPLPWQSQQERC